MLEPAISVLKEKADSRYSLVIMAAKRARDLVDGKPTILPSSESERSNISKPVSIAVNEIARDMISYTRGSDIDMPDENLIQTEVYDDEKEAADESCFDEDEQDEEEDVRDDQGEE